MAGVISKSYTLRILAVDIQFIDTMPGINNILSMIKTRRRRDAIIIGVVVAVCLLSLLSYMSR